MEAISIDPNVLLIAFGIFTVRVFNMALDTVRMLTVVRGMRTVTWILGFMQTVLFVIALGSVINDLNNPLNIIAYATGFATGNVIGMMIEKRLAFGYINLTIISSFASSTFLLIFAAINLSALRLRDRIEASIAVAVTGLICTLASWLALIVYLYQSNRASLYWIGGLYLAVFLAEVLFSQRRWIRRELEEIEESEELDEMEP